MADQISELLRRCENPSKGCFASDEGAIKSMLYMDDAVIRRDFQRIAGAADKAGTEGLPLEEGTYTEVTLTVVGSMGSLGDGETKSLGDILSNPGAEAEHTVANSAARIARCAYVCGQVGVGNCPVKTPQQQ